MSRKDSSYSGMVLRNASKTEIYVCVMEACLGDQWPSFQVLGKDCQSVLPPCGHLQNCLSPGKCVSSQLWIQLKTHFFPFLLSGRKVILRSIHFKAVHTTPLQECCPFLSLLPEHPQSVARCRNQKEVSKKTQWLCSRCLFSDWRDKM